MSKRALRRHHRRRLRRKRTVLRGSHWAKFATDRRYAGLLARTATPCSCMMCSRTKGRTFGEVTNQECVFEDACLHDPDLLHHRAA